MVQPAGAPPVEVKEAEGYKLHLATRSDSTTGYLGVSKLATGKFLCQASGKNLKLGYFNTAVEAAVAYAQYAGGAGERMADESEYEDDNAEELLPASIAPPAPRPQQIAPQQNAQPSPAKAKKPSISGRQPWWSFEEGFLLRRAKHRLTIRTRGVAAATHACGAASPYTSQSTARGGASVRRGCRKAVMVGCFNRLVVVVGCYSRRRRRRWSRRCR